MLDLLVSNALIVTANANNEVVPAGALAIQAGRIVAIYQPGADLPPAQQVIDAADRIVMPGLINTHCHAADSLFRGLVENLSLEAWLEQVWIAEKAILTPQTCELGSLLGLAENLRAGVTTVVDMFWYPQATVAAAEQLGMRVATGGLFFDPPGVGERSHADYLREAQEFFAAHADSDYVFPATMPHGAYTVSPEHLQEAWRIADAHGGLFHTHAAETAVEQADVTKRYGTSVIRHLAELGTLNERTLLAHCVHIDDEEIALLAQTKTAVAHNPLSNLKLGSGFAPLAKLLDAGVRVSLGTDGAISGNDLDMWLSMRLAATLPKGQAQRADLISAEQVIQMATVNGAKALGVADQLGSLEVGKQADFILVDTSALHALPLFDPATHLVYAAGRADVTDVFIGGSARVRERTLVDVDLAAVRAEVAALSSPTLAALGR